MVTGGRRGIQGPEVVEMITTLCLFSGETEFPNGCSQVQFSSAQSLSHVRLFVIPWTVARQVPLSMGLSRQGYWSGLPCPPPGDLPDPGIEPTSLTSPPLAGRFFTTSTTWEAIEYIGLNLGK